MSTPRILNQHEVNKLILAKNEFERPSNDLQLPTGRYQDEELRIYAEKCDQFRRCCDAYRKKNEKVLISNIIKLDIETDKELCFDFIPKEEDLPDVNCQNFENGGKKRERFLRPFKPSSGGKSNISSRNTMASNIWKEVEENEEDADNYEEKQQEKKIQSDLGRKLVSDAWLFRYLKLNKFIKAARTIIIKKRMLKRLEKMKNFLISREILGNLAENVKEKPYVINDSYAELFQKFLE